jgi:hypothetical protein
MYCMGESINIYFTVDGIVPPAQSSEGTTLCCVPRTMNTHRYATDMLFLSNKEILQLIMTTNV